MSQQDNIEQVTLTIDGKQVTVPKGTFILHAARKAGIHIPTFCEYPDLRPFGACRMCMVEITTRRGTSIDISCSTPVSEGMIVQTRSPKVREAQRFVVEALLVDHPLDCPVCDKSGECDLQNHAYLSQVRVNNPLRRPKISWELEMLSESVSIKRDRCVLCGRCVRVCDELVGATALSWAQRGFRSYIDAAFGEDLKKSPCVSCGLCIQVCPVGALLNTSYHDTARAWFLTHVPSVCSFCSVGCSMDINVEQETGRVKRITSNQDTGFNNQLLCARGFFGFEFIESRERLSSPLIRRDGELVEASWDEAIKEIASRLPVYKGSFGAIAGAHCTNEENYLFGKFVRGVMQTNNIDYDTGGGYGVPEKGLRDVFGSDAATNSFLDVMENAGSVLVIGSNLDVTHPVLAYKLQTAVRRHQIKLIVASPRQVPLEQFASKVIRYREGSEAELLQGIAAIIASRGQVDDGYVSEKVEGYEEWLNSVSTITPSNVSRITGVSEVDLLEVADIYATGGTGDLNNKRPSAIFYSTSLTHQPNGELVDYGAAALALLTGNIGLPGGGVMALKMANNSQGAVDMGCAPFLLPGEFRVDDDEARSRLESMWGVEIDPNPGMSLEQMIDAALSGDLKAMYIMGANPVESSYDSDKVRAALSNLSFLVVQDIFLTETAKLADVVLPACSWVEKEGTYTSAERRIQYLHKAIPARGLSVADWGVITQIMQAMGYEVGYRNPKDIFAEITRVVPRYSGITIEDLESEGKEISRRPGKAYRSVAVDNIKRHGVIWTDAPDGNPILYTQTFPIGKAKLMPVVMRTDLPDAAQVYKETLEPSLYVQGTGTITRRCPTLKSLHDNKAADSSLERGRGVGVVRGPHLEMSGYSTGQLTEI